KGDNVRIRHLLPHPLRDARETAILSPVRQSLVPDGDRTDPAGGDGRGLANSLSDQANRLVEICYSFCCSSAACFTFVIRSISRPSLLLCSGNFRRLLPAIQSNADRSYLSALSPLPRE